MSKHRLPDGREVIIRPYKNIPEAVRSPYKNKGLAELLALVRNGEYIEIPVDGNDSPVRTINGNIRSFEKTHGVKFTIRDMGNGRIRAYRVE